MFFQPTIRPWTLVPEAARKTLTSGVIFAHRKRKKYLFIFSAPSAFAWGYAPFPKFLDPPLPVVGFILHIIITFVILGELGELRRRSHHAIARFASHRCGPSSIPGLGRGRMCEKFRQLLAAGRWFPPGTPVSSTRKLISSSSFHRLDMTLAVAEALNRP